MDATFDVLLRVVNNVMHEPVTHAVISDGLIGIDGSAFFDVVQNFSLQSFALHIRHDCRANLPEIPVEHSHYDCLTVMGTYLLIAQSAIFVHISDSTADKGFVYFDFSAISAKFLTPIARYSESMADSLQHEPCGLLGDSESSTEFMGTDAVFTVNQHPNCRHPLVQADWRILEDAAHLDGELFLAGIAVPDATGLNERVLLRVATGTSDLTVRPAEFDRIVESSVRVRKVDDCFLESMWRFHVTNSKPKAIVCQVYYCPYIRIMHNFTTKPAKHPFWWVTRVIT